MPGLPRQRSSAPAMRRNPDAAGRRAERAAAWLLRAKGYAILARRFKTRAGEIDLVAARGNTLAFVEVKTRPDAPAALESLRPRQRARIARAAEHFLRTRPELTGHAIRFDLVACRPWRLPLHVQDAWRP